MRIYLQKTWCKPRCCNNGLLLFLLSLVFLILSLQVHDADAAPTTVLDGKLVAGYQGWFATSCDHSPAHSWIHWSPGVDPSPGHITFDIWPDVREYDPQDLCPTPSLGPLGNGAPSQLYSAYSSRVVDTHVSWAKSYGLDGLALQRFVVELTDAPRASIRTSVTDWMRQSCEDHQLPFYIEYDVSGAPEDAWVDTILEDWEQVLQGKLQLLNSSMYWRDATTHQPFVMLWGAGFPDRPGTPQQWIQLIDYFHAANILVGGGVPYRWRTGEGVKDGFTDPDAVFAKFDVLEPWAVGAIRTDSDIEKDFSSVVPDDMSWCSARGVAYRRGIFAGFSWSNWNGGSQNMIPRRAGKFMWNQALAAQKLGLNGAFVAMFDEYDEGTAINKAAEDAGMRPTNQWFLSLDADDQLVSSDFYLRLAGTVAKLLRGQIEPSAQVPIPYYAPSQIPPQSTSSYQSHTWSANASAVIVNLGYRVVLNRAADADGQQTYGGMVASGHLGSFFAALLSSQEFVLHRSLWTVDELVVRSFSVLLGRSPDPSGQQSTTADIQQGLAASRFSDMVASPEFCNVWQLC